ncbi:MAG: non-reducing end alpha-L-arabinofuranosidase family hydrolase [Polyangiaceae bacterium]
MAGRHLRVSSSRTVNAGLFLLLSAALAAGCSDSKGNSANTGGAGAGNGGNAGSSATGGGTGVSQAHFNQCGVAAPLPAESQCKLVSAPAITNFDDFTGDDASKYGYYLNAKPPAAEAVIGSVLHVGDGSDANGTSVIATEMVPGRGGSGYALQFSDTNATNWGGLLMFYFPGSTASTACIDSSAYSGVEFWIKGSSPSGKFGVSVGMLDTNPVSDGGFCNNASSSDCKGATIELPLATDAETWTQVRVPWSALTPGLGSGKACVPVTGQNMVRLSVQPFMNYPPPNYTFAPGAYKLAIDDVQFYTDPNAGKATLSGGGSGSCTLAPSLSWSSTPQLISPVSDATHDLRAVKDPSIVRYNDKWHVYASSVSTAGAYSMVYTSFSDFNEAASAPVYYMNNTPGFAGYTAAPQLFYFTPQKKWYLVYQAGPPMFSTADAPDDPTRWTAPAPFFASEPAIVKQNGGWLDFWVICDDASCHLFFTNNHGHWYTSKTPIGQFPNGFSDPVVVMQDNNSGRMFEATNVYKMNGTGQYLALIESFDQTSNNKRYFRSWVSNSLDGPWFPWQASGSFPYAGLSNVHFDGTPWSNDISHGEMIRAGYDEKLAVEPCNMRFLYQGADPNADNGGDYNKIPWRLGLITQTP